MKVHEYQAKQLFARYGIPIPQGEVARSPEEAKAIAQRLGQTCRCQGASARGRSGESGRGSKSPKRPRMPNKPPLKSWA